jgi:hypothetical protein
MDEIKIVTNNVPRAIVEGYELTETERAEFDYVDWADVEAGNASPEFFRYKGELRYLESEGRPAFAPGWDGYLSDSFFSGILFRFPPNDWNGQPDYERIVIGRYYA